MSAGGIAALALLAAGVVSLCAASASLLVLRTPLQRVHLVGVATIFGAAPVALGVAVAAHRYAGSGYKAAFIALVLAVFSPVLTHETLRAIASREEGGAP